MKHSKSRLARLNDENFKKNNKGKYCFYLVGFYVQYILMPIVILFGTVLCIISLILWRNYELGLFPYKSELLQMDLVIPIY